MSGIPLTKQVVLFNELIAEVNKLVKTPPSNEFDGMRQKRILEAKVAEIKRENTGLGFAAQGVVDSVMDNVKGMRANHETSLKYFDHPITKSNYAGSLEHQGFLTESYVWAKRALEEEPLNKFSLSLLISLSYHLNMDEDMEELFDTYRKVTGESHDLESVTPEMVDADVTYSCIAMSEDALAKSWDTPEEDEAWANL